MRNEGKTKEKKGNKEEWKRKESRMRKICVKKKE